MISEDGGHVTTEEPVMTEIDRSARELCPSRRSLLRALAAVGVGSITSGVLVACGAPAREGAATPSATSTPSATPTPSATQPSTTQSAAPATVVVATAEVPVGTALVVEVAGQRIVVAQPSAGSFVGFSTTCTHEGTPINVYGDGLELACPNHGSRFSAADGSVQRGPAESSLDVVAVRVEGDQLVLA